MDQVSKRDVTPQQTIARIAHEANRAYCDLIGEAGQMPWAHAPDWQRDSAIAGVAGIVNGDILSPRDSHASWLEQKLREGWCYGPVKDPKQKLHPCMVDYDNLPPGQRVKDAIFHGVVNALIVALDVARGPKVVGLEAPATALDVARGPKVVGLEAPATGLEPPQAGFCEGCE